MNNTHNKIKKVLVFSARLLPWLILAVVFISFLAGGGEISLEDILNYTPENPFAAAAFMWLVYAVKGVFMIPIKLLFLVGGRIFPLPAALLVNTVGLALAITVPYILGRFSGRDLTVKLLEKYPRLSEFRQLRDKNAFFFSFIIRAIGIVSGDMVSLYCGNTRIPYIKYLAGGVLGYMTRIICVTVAGREITDLTSPVLYIAIAVNIVTCGLALLIFRIYRKKSEEKERKPDNG